MNTVAAQDSLTLNLLGPIEARRDGTPVDLGGAKPRTVLAALLLARSRVVPDTELTALLWGESPPATCSAQIHTYASRVRRLLGPAVRVERRRPGYLLRLPEHGVGVDLLAFRQYAARGTEALAGGAPGTAARVLRQALDVWRGTALGGVCDPLADLERDRLEEERLTTLERRLDADLDLGRHTEVIPELIALIAANPLREGLRGQLMTALYRSGRQADALAAYRAARATLAEELGLEPCADLQRLHQALLTGHPSLLPRTTVRATAATGAAADRAGPPAPAELPPAPTGFTGREQEVARLTEALTGRCPGPAVHTVTGMPGAGKTALALVTAHRAAERYPDGQVHLDLRGSGPAPLDPADALGELLRLLGVPAGRTPGTLDERVRAYRTRIAGRRLLLVLDDAHGERQVRPLLPATDGCAALVTSRSGLHALDAVGRTTLGPLPAADARALFEKLAGGSRASAEPGAAAGIVRACAGLPLALRIAGGRAAARPHWPLARLAERLAEPRRTLDELTLGDLSLTDRLWAAYRGLDPQSRRALRFHSALGPHAVPPHAAARALGTAPERAEDLLAGLAEAHWCEVVRQRDGYGYRMHPLVRLFARARLAEEEGTVPRPLPVHLPPAPAGAVPRTG
ncbi:regulatory protein [Streptomyces toyocaensis]|uniref:Regulatory protein n=1 Tax=Streptomyces toyocaensis TaxID=55952 RepID=A0A081XHY5_STRTO|nr:AfsR/SARP family transcriptional regulator [Streptomyces toyocaensis]KES03158.1 regulatory protein [Streptomyces toyocaensis]